MRTFYGVLIVSSFAWSLTGFSESLTETSRADDADAKLKTGWTKSGQIGAKIHTNESSMVPSQKDGLTQIYGFNLDLAGFYKRGPLVWKNTLADETAFSRLPGLPKATKTADEIKVGSQINYSFLSSPDLGSYTKLGLRANLLDAEDVRDGQSDFVATKRNGEVLTESTDVFKTGTSLGRIVTRESLGLFYTPLSPAYLTAELRFGFGLEQSLVKDEQYILKDKEETPALEYSELDGYHIGGLEYGIESTYKLAEKVRLNLAADGLTPLVVDQKIKDIHGSNTLKLTSWTVGAKTSLTLYTWLALAWELKLRREPLVQPEVQKTQTLALQASYSLL